MVDGVELLFRPLMMLGRFLLWLVWELFVEMFAWSIGWAVCRTITFGTWPKARFNEQETLYWWEAAIVEMIGFAAIFLLIYLVVS